LLNCGIFGGEKALGGGPIRGAEALLFASGRVVGVVISSLTAVEAVAVFHGRDEWWHQAESNR